MSENFESNLSSLFDAFMDEMNRAHVNLKREYPTAVITGWQIDKDSNTINLMSMVMIP